MTIKSELTFLCVLCALCGSVFAIEALKAQLYNVKDDPSQKTNVIREHPEKAEEMQAALISLCGRVVRPR
jgi:hypothetical protein